MSNDRVFHLGSHLGSIPYTDRIPWMGDHAWCMVLHGLYDDLCDTPSTGTFFFYCYFVELVDVPMSFKGDYSCILDSCTILVLCCDVFIRHYKGCHAWMYTRKI